MALNHVLQQLQEKDQECSTLANELRLLKNYCKQDRKHLDTLLAKEAHFQAQTSRLTKMANEMMDAYRISDQSCAAANKSVEEKLELKTALKIALDEHKRSLAKIQDILSTSIAQARTHLDRVASVRHASFKPSATNVDPQAVN